MKNDTLVLGIGNLLMKDEGVGIHVVKRLESEGVTDADLMDGGTGGFKLLGVIQSYRRIIIIDASLDNFPAGTVRIIYPRYAREFPQQLSAHEIGLKDLLDAVYLLGDDPQICLIAISVKDFHDLGTDLSPDVERAIPEAIRIVGKLLRYFRFESNVDKRLFFR